MTGDRVTPPADAVVLNRAAILEADDLPIEPLFVREWGGLVYIRTLSGAERDTWEVENFRRDPSGNENDRNTRALLAVMTVVSENGTRLFADNDAEALGKKSSLALDRVWDVACRLNGIGEKAKKEREKNSGKVVGDDS